MKNKNNQQHIAYGLLFCLISAILVGLISDYYEYLPFVVIIPAITLSAFIASVGVELFCFVASK